MHFTVCEQNLSYLLTLPTQGLRASLHPRPSPVLGLSRTLVCWTQTQTVYGSQAIPPAHSAAPSWVLALQAQGSLTAGATPGAGICCNPSGLSRCWHTNAPGQLLAQWTCRALWPTVPLPWHKVLPLASPVLAALWHSGLQLLTLRHPCPTMHTEQRALPQERVTIYRKIQHTLLIRLDERTNQQTIYIQLALYPLNSLLFLLKLIPSSTFSSSPNCPMISFFPCIPWCVS